MKFLVIRFSSIGDIVLTTPVVRCLKKQVADAEVHFLTKQGFRGIVDTNPYIDKVHVLADSFELMLHELQTEEYDYIIDLHHNLRTLRIKRFLKKVKSVSFNKLNVEKFILTNLKINMLPDKHIVDRNMATVSSFGVTNDGEGLDYFIPDRDVVDNRDLPTSHLHGYIAVVIGAALATKKLPLHKLKEICSAIDHPLILLGGKEDYEDGKAIAAVDEVKIYNACGKFSLNESADLVRRSKLVISHDTGLMHIAAALQKPLVSVWGNTIPEFGMYPYYGKYSKQHFDVVEIKKLWCRPCSKIGYKKCPRGHFNCMEKIAVNDIINLVSHRLRK
ncbi:MAG TPA: glycosyltransferase family 9 protein [Ferruginibacter sp.]|nr:glycosyl transferase [Chitinophagaceae bacterium]HRI24016.1 glycosyltransferase family 9 protein [Ferruginibacter sp.]